jgi:hypothetical protein
MDLLGKGLGDIKRNLIFDNVVASPSAARYRRRYLDWLLNASV